MTPARASRLGLTCAALLTALLLPSRGSGAEADLYVGGGVVSTDNLFLSPPEEAESATIWLVTPGATLDWTERDDFLRLSYHGQYWDFRDTWESLWLHDLSASLSWHRWSPFFLEADERRDVIPRSPDRLEDAVTDLVDRNRLGVRAGLAWDLAPTATARLYYQGEALSYPGESDAERNRSHFGRAALTKRWNPFWESTVEAGYGTVRREIAPGYDELAVRAQAVQHALERLDVTYGLEGRWDRVREGDGGTEFIWLASFLAAYRLEHSGSADLRYTESVQDTLTGERYKDRLASAGVLWRGRAGGSFSVRGALESLDYIGEDRSSLAWGPDLAFRWPLAGWLALTGSGSWRSQKEEGAGALADNSVLRLGSALVATLARHVELEAGYASSGRSSEDDTLDYSVNCWYAMLTCYLRQREADERGPVFSRPAIATTLPRRE